MANSSATNDTEVRRLTYHLSKVTEIYPMARCVSLNNLLNYVSERQLNPDVNQGFVIVVWNDKNQLDDILSPRMDSIEDAWFMAFELIMRKMIKKLES